MFKCSIYCIMNKEKPEIKKEGKKVFDLICGMELDSYRVEHIVKYRGQTYYFCSRNCRNHFEQNPEKYVGD